MNRKQSTKMINEIHHRTHSTHLRTKDWRKTKERKIERNK